MNKCSNNKNCSNKNNLNNLPAWDLGDLYAGVDDPRIERDLQAYKQAVLDFANKYKGKLASLSASEFAAAIREYERRYTLSGILGEYSYLNMVTQMKNKDAMAFYQNISEKFNEYSKPTIFWSLEINQLPQSKIDEWLKNEEVAAYAPWLQRLRVFKDYELSEPVEEVLHEKDLTSGSGWVRLYEETSSRLKFVVDGKEYNDAEITKLVLDKDPAVRRAAGLEIGRVCKENAHLFSLIYNMRVKDKEVEDTKRGFKSPIASQNMVNRVDDSVVEALANTVRANYGNLSHRFYKLKAKWLGLKKLENWDRNAPLPFSDDTTYSWEESVKIVLDAYSEFSPKLNHLAFDFFQEKSWIDVPPRDGKRSGAFAAPVSSTKHPYLLLNFVGKQNDVLTLAHELGHGCHMRLSAKQGEINDATPLTLAEVASVFGEMVTFQSLLRKTTDDKTKLTLLASKVNDMLNTAVRQIAYHFFETRVHNERKNGEVSEDRLAEIWGEEMRASLGDAINIDEHSQYNWSQVGHFFWQPFYVYAYSFADCLVNSLYQVYQEGSVADFEDKYLHMLSETGIKKYDELLQPFGLDAKNPDFWNKGLGLISHYIDELEKLDKKLGL